MSKQLESLSISEQNTVSEALLKLVASWIGMPKGIIPQWQNMEEAESIGLYTMQGAVYLKKNILGGFTAQVPFMVRYACRPTNNQTRIKKQKVLEDLGEWLEKATYPPLTDNRIITSIERTTGAFLMSRDDSGSEIYQCNLKLDYRKEN